MTGGLDEHTSALLSAVEQQLTRYFASISRQVDAQKVATTEAIEAQHRANGDYQEALRAALEERLVAFAQHQHERMVAIEEQFDALAANPAAAADLTGINSRLEATERTLVDRMLAVEHRVSDEFGRRMADLEAVVGRVNAGFDEAIGALSQRMLELDNRVASLTARTDDLAARQLSVDPLEIESLRTLASGAAGEAALLRMDLERLTSTAGEQFDHYAVRIADIENTLQGEADVNSAVQLERLDELERQVNSLDLSAIGRPVTTAMPTIIEPTISAPAMVAPVLPAAEPVAPAAPVQAPEPIAASPVAAAPAPVDSITPAQQPAEVWLPGSPVATPVIPEPIIVEPVLRQPVFTLPEPVLAPAPTPAAATPAAAAPEPAAAAPTSSLLADLVAATPVAPVTAAATPSVNDTTEVPVLRAPALTRRMAAPPPMTLTPRLPSTTPAEHGSTATESSLGSS